MRLLFLDSSDPKDCRYYITGAFCIDASRLPGLLKEFHIIKSQFVTVTPTMEIKWATRGVYDDGKKVNTLSGKQHNLYRKQVANLLANSNITLLGGVLDKEHYREFDRVGQYLNSIEVVCTKFQYHLSEENDTGVVIVDHLSNHKETHRAQKQIAEIAQRGAMWAKLNRISIPAIIYRSDLMAGLQIADCIAGMLSFKINRQEGEFYDEIKGKFRTSSDGETEGYGISFIPKATIKTIKHW